MYVRIYNLRAYREEDMWKQENYTEAFWQECSVQQTTMKTLLKVVL